jgi:hypothetical protein
MYSGWRVEEDAAANYVAEIATEAKAVETGDVPARSVDEERRRIIATYGAKAVETGDAPA